MNLLFTPGPLTTSSSVKEATLYDLGPRDSYFMGVIQSINKKLLKIANLTNRDYDVVLMQGPGTMGIESVINTTIGPKNKVLVVINGAYGQRIKKICDKANIHHQVLEYPWNTTANPHDIVNILSKDQSITNIAIVHSETTTGLLNPIEEIGKAVANHSPNVSYMVDAMSSFGAIPIDIDVSNINYLVTSANKCLQGLPGFSIVFANLEHLKANGNHARTLSLDLLDQWETMKKSGQFRFTPPVQSLLAFNQALNELEEEGGIIARNQRYIENQKLLSKHMMELGFRPYLKREVQGPIITAFREPKDFKFRKFYDKLNKRGITIYSGKIAQTNTFRVGNIGHLYRNDIISFNKIVRCVVKNMKIRY